MRRKTKEQYEYEMSQINPHLELIGDYINQRTKIRIRNRNCGHEWDASAITPIIKKYNCPICNNRYKTTSDFIKEMEVVNPNIDIIGKYKNNSTGILVRCKKCSHEWNPIPNSLLRGNGCPHCYGRISSDEFIEKLSNTHNHISIIGNYKGSKEKTHFYCSIHNKNFYKMPYRVLQEDNPCPDCRNQEISRRQTRTNDQYRNELSSITQYIEPLDKYVKDNVPILHMCKKCGYKWEISPQHIMESPSCPNCNGTSGETLVANYLTSNNISYECQKSFPDLKYKKPLFYDFYLPKYNVLIEYDGEFHYFPVISEENFNVGKIRDKFKNDYAIKNNITLIRIPYWDKGNIDDILNEKLKEEI